MKQSAKPQKHAGKSIEEFRRSHDKNLIIPDRIRAGLKALGGGWDYEREFMRTYCGSISATDIANFRDSFADFWFITSGRNPKRIWCGTKELAKRLAAMV